MSTPLPPREEKPDPGANALSDEMVAFWKDAGKTLVKESISSNEEVAKQIIGVAGILEGLYFHAITYSDLFKRGPLAAGTMVYYLVPIGLLLLSLFCALAVFFPARHKMNLLSSDACRKVFERTVQRKLWLVRLAAVFLTLGILFVMNATWLYLQG